MNNSYYLTENEIKMLDESISSIISNFNLTKISSAFSRNMIVVKKYLKDHGVDTSYIVSEGKKIGGMVREGYDSKKDPQDVGKSIVYSIGKNVISKISKEIRRKTGISEAVVKSVLIFVAIFLLQVVIMTAIGSLAVSPLTTMFIMCTVIAPITEEYGKRIAVESDYPFIYTGIFAGIEFLLYVIQGVQMGIALPIVVLQRLAAVMMHFATTLIQKKHHDDSVVMGEEEHIKGYYVAVGVHALWNLVAFVIAIS
jgi:hypothetical protein